MDMKRQVGVVDSPSAALDLREAPGVVVAMKVRYAIQAELAVLDFDMVIRDAVAGIPVAGLFVVAGMLVAEYIDMVCGLVV
jgi:hypothetical protein